MTKEKTQADAPRVDIIGRPASCGRLGRKRGELGRSPWASWRSCCFDRQCRAGGRLLLQSPPSQGSVWLWRWQAPRLGTRRVWAPSSPLHLGGPGFSRSDTGWGTPGGERAGTRWREAEVGRRLIRASRTRSLCLVFILSHGRSLRNFKHRNDLI